MAVASIQVSETPLVLYTLRRADDALILGHRLSEWCGHAPMLEEDMALANMGLDLLGQARELYAYAARVEGKGNDEDKLAYLRDVRQYRNLLLLEQPNGDFARTMVRQFFYSAFADPYWRAMMQSGDATLAAIDDLWAYTGEMFETDDSERSLIADGIAIDPATLRARWLKTVSDVVSEAT